MHVIHSPQSANWHFTIPKGSETPRPFIAMLLLLTSSAAFIYGENVGFAPADDPTEVARPLLERSKILALATSWYRC